MRIKNHIEWQIENDISLEKELREIKNSLSNTKRQDAKLLTRIIGLAKKYPTRDIVLLTFIDFLQLTNSRNLVKQFGLDDINNLFNHLCKYNPTNYEIHFEYYYFLYNVLDKEAAAKKMLSAYIRKTNIQIDKMKKLV